MVQQISGNSDSLQFTNIKRADLANKRMDVVNSRVINPHNDEPIPKLNNVAFVKNTVPSATNGQLFYPSARERLEIAQGQKPESMLDRLHRVL